MPKKNKFVDVKFIYSVPSKWEEHFKKYHACYHKALARKLYVIFQKIKNKQYYEDIEKIDLTQLTRDMLEELKQYYQENNLI